MAVREQRQFTASATEPAIARLRLLVVALTGVVLLFAGTSRGGSVTPPYWSVWVVVLLAAGYAAANSGFGLYKRYRRVLTRRVTLLIDVLLITAIVGLAGGESSPFYLLYALPLVVVVVHHGVRAGFLYCLGVSCLYSVVATLPSATLPAEERAADGPLWIAQLCFLWALYGLLSYLTYADDDREERARRRDELGAMHRAAAAPMHTGDIPTVIENVLAGALGATNCCSAAIWLFDEEDDRFTTCYWLTRADRDGAVRQEAVQVRDSDVLYRVLYTGSSEAITDLYAERRLRESALSKERKRSAIVTPLVAPGAKKVGILSLGREECHRATPHELRFADTIALQAAVAVHSAYQFQEAASMEAARETDRLRSQLLASVSHELRTPITAIQGFASSLRCDEIPIPKEVQDDWLAEIESNADRLKRLVTDLLDLSRLEVGALRMAFEWQDVGDVIEDVRPNLEILAETRNLVIQSSPPLPLVRCDAERIQQVLTNLVENAAKFSPPDSNLVIGAERYGDGVRIGVLDEGEGIPPEHQERVFERFYQVEGSEFRAQKGTGLGLAICRNIVEAHGGALWVESSPGQGSVFYLTLPSPGAGAGV